VVLERDNRTGDFAGLKTLVKVRRKAAADGLIGSDEKSVYDMIPDLEATNGWITDKPEGVAITGDGRTFVVTDNDGVEDWSGETWFLDLGRYWQLKRGLDPRRASGVRDVGGPPSGRLRRRGRGEGAAPAKPRFSFLVPRFSPLAESQAGRRGTGCRRPALGPIAALAPPISPIRRPWRTWLPGTGHGRGARRCRCGRRP
jgi:hypothetical protein